MFGFVYSEVGVFLIEMLVVVVIIGVVVMVVVLLIQLGMDLLDDEVDCLFVCLIFVEQDVISIGQFVGVVVEDYGVCYSFYCYVDWCWWLVCDNDVLGGY